MTPPSISEKKQHRVFRDLWAIEGTLARAALRFGEQTGLYEFGLREMLRDQLERPIPGVFLSLPARVTKDSALQEEIFQALASQRTEVRQSAGRVFTSLAGLQQAVLNGLNRAPGLPAPSFHEMTLAEARCKDLMLVARLLVEQAAMREAFSYLPEGAPAAEACHALWRASELAIAEFDTKLRNGVSLQLALAADILVESLGQPLPPDFILPFKRK